ncbi:ankyrin repeat, SAM and basic leucine zipper domain-containing protein 1-like isoform X2 [Amblyomma americanum]
MVRLLLDNGADANFNKGLVTPLMAVCSCRNRDEAALVTCAKILLKHGASPDFADRNGVTPLMLAAREGHCQLLELLLDQGANSRCMDSQGWSALSWAAYGGQGRAARLLLQKVPADVLTLATLDGQMPSDLALSQGYCTLSQILCRFEAEQLKQSGDRSTSDLDMREPWFVSQPSRKFQNAFGDVALVLAAAGVEQWLPLLQEHGIGFQEMLNLDDKALLEMGVKLADERARILAAVESTRLFQTTGAQPSATIDYGMESFLSALDMVELADTLRDHNVATLGALLRLDEAGLERAGIEQVGTRTRLAAAIRRAHQLPWHKSSVTDVRKATAITCPGAVSVVSTVRQHLGHLEVSMSHLRQHLSRRPEDLQLGRDLCSIRHLRDELRKAHEALHALATQLNEVDQLAAQVEGHVEYQPQWPPLPARAKQSRHSLWLPLCLLATTLWACKAAGVLGQWPLLLPQGWSVRHPA